MTESQNHLDVMSRHLSERHSSPVRLIEVEELRPGRVIRVSVESGVAGLPATMILKGPPVDASPETHETRETHETQWRNELAALQFLATFHPPIAPAVLSSDVEARVIALEDLGESPSLSDILLWSDAGTAATAMVDFARLIGRLHRESSGRVEEYYAIRQGLGPVDRQRDRYFIRRRDVRGCLADVIGESMRHGLPAPGGRVSDEFEEILAFLAEPGDCLAFTTGDPCPDNVVVREGVAQLVDYEVAAFRHALLDAAYFVLPLPNCWCWRRFPEPVLDGMLAAYRAEISPVMPSVSEDASFDAGLSRCSAAWLVFHLASRLPFVVESNRSFDLFNERERLITMLRNFARLPATPAVTPYVGEWLGRLGERFEAMWPSEAATVQLYPAFQRERPVAPAFPAQPLS
ncbi:MAG: phosphotransferase [Acidimicrobiales bacterium]